jgi:uncharacterized protein YjfI (DUF2170 family)
MTPDTLVQAINEWAASNESSAGIQMTARQDGDTVVVIDNASSQAVFVSLDGKQLLCTTKLFSETDVNPDKRGALQETMLRANLPLQLSAFGLMGDDYILFGALHSDSAIDVVIAELETLFINSEAVVEDLESYLTA